MLDWYDAIVLGVISALYAVLFFWILKDDDKKVLIRVEKDAKIYRTILNEDTGEQELYYEKKRFLFQRIIVSWLYIEFVKEYLIIKGAQPFQMLLGDNYITAWLLILVGLPIGVILIGGFLFAFTQFRERGTPIVIIKLEDLPVDRFGKLLSEDVVKELLESEKGHELVIMYIYYDKQGRLRASTTNVIKMFNDDADFVHLTGKLSDYPTINFQEIGGYSEECILIPAVKIIRSKVRYTDDRSAVKYEVYSWEYEGTGVLKELLNTTENKVKQREEFLEALSFAHVFTRLQRAYDRLNNRINQLIGSIPLIVRYRVAKEREKVELQKLIITRTVKSEQIKDKKKDEEEVEKSALKKEKEQIDEIFHAEVQDTDEIDKMLQETISG